MLDKTVRLHYAHSGRAPDRSDWQSLKDHLDQTAELAATFALPLNLSRAARLTGAMHDWGKHDPAFDNRLTGGPERVDHSTAGGRLLLDRADRATVLAAQVLAHAILGHHAGLPDTSGEAGGLNDRVERFQDPIDPAINASAQIDLRPVMAELMAKCRPGTAEFDLSLAGRMVFSCLVDADYRDTEAFYATLDGIHPDRNWPSLTSILPVLRAALDARLAGFAPDSDLNRLRADILAHLRAASRRPRGLYTLTVPTGGGKTLASMAFALGHAAAHGHRRVIYAIPYTSIIDQTAATFRELFGDVVLEHHSSIEVETFDKDKAQGRDKTRLAMEDWAAPIVVTTNVQLFESLFAARPARARKLHNIANSVIILDEAQCLPRHLLRPTLRMIDALAALYGCTILLCTATQPAFDSAQLQDGGLDLTGRELAPDPPALARQLRRARIVPGDVMTDDDLVAGLRAAPQGIVIVNSRKHALALFDHLRAEGLEGTVHLTTRQYPADRRRIITDIRDRLKTGQPCRLIATSLIEAGVDLDFPIGWRAEAGLDSIIQAAGRVNREGKRPLEASTLTVFTPAEHTPSPELAKLALATRSTALRHDLDAPEAIHDWFEQVYWTTGEMLDRHGIVQSFVCGRAEVSFPYRTTAEVYRMIDSTMVPVIIPTDSNAANLDRLGVAEVPSGRLARALQPYTVQIPTRDRALLRANGRGDFAAPQLRSDQFFVLTDKTLYQQGSGLWWEGADQLAEGQRNV
jgi:CRISPR-associated endonuclease/helicase Cas3